MCVRHALTSNCFVVSCQILRRPGWGHWWRRCTVWRRPPAHQLWTGFLPAAQVTDLMVNLIWSDQWLSAKLGSGHTLTSIRHSCAFALDIPVTYHSGVCTYKHTGYQYHVCVMITLLLSSMGSTVTLIRSCTRLSHKHLTVALVLYSDIQS